MNWLPEGRTAAVCFSVDDVHPSTSGDPYEAGGDLGRGALGRIERLLERHRQLKATLFVTPDWRPVQLVRSRIAARLPLLSDCVYHVDLHPKGRFRLDRCPHFVRYLNGLPRVETAPHGLHHVHRGPNLAVEFQEQTYRQCVDTLKKSIEIFESAGLDYVKGFAPPGWNLPDSLSAALADLNFKFVSSARDLRTPIARDARSRMSGLENVSLIRPEPISEELIHVPVNFQATSKPDRARQIVACNGLLSVKAHVFKRGGGYTMADGLDDAYCEYLDGLFFDLRQRYGDSLWWTSMREIAERCRVAHGDRSSGWSQDNSGFIDERMQHGSAAVS